MLVNLNGGNAVSPTRGLVILLIFAIFAVDVAVLYYISRNAVANGRRFIKDNFRFKRVKLVYPKPQHKKKKNLFGKKPEEDNGYGSVRDERDSSAFAYFEDNSLEYPAAAEDSEFRKYRKHPKTKSNSILDTVWDKVEKRYLSLRRRRRRRRRPRPRQTTRTSEMGLPPSRWTGGGGGGGVRVDNLTPITKY
jgi:hypothetical protein